MSEIRLATLSTVMLSREDLQLASCVLMEQTGPNALGAALLRVADALSSIITHTGVQAIACAETVEEGKS